MKRILVSMLKCTGIREPCMYVTTNCLSRGVRDKAKVPKNLWIISRMVLEETIHVYIETQLLMEVIDITYSDSPLRS